MDWELLLNMELYILYTQLLSLIVNEGNNGNCKKTNLKSNNKNSTLNV